MADEPEDEELLLEDQIEGDEPEDDDPEQGEVQSEEPDEGDDDGIDFSFGDEAAPASGKRDTPLIKHLRTQLREEQKRRKEAESRAPSQQIEVGPKPTLAGCDYDEERFEAELGEWHDRSRQAQAAETEQQTTRRKAQEEFERDHQRYQTERSKLLEKAPDAEEAEAVAMASLNEVQQAVIVKVAGNAAHLLAALGRHPAKLSELSQITDPLKMAAAVARLEGGLKVMPKRKAPEPERIARGSAPMSKGSASKEHARLEKEAERTGNYTALIRYEQSQKSKVA